MLLLRLIEFGAAAFLVIFLVTQVVTPLWKGEPLAPYFRDRRRLEDRLAEVRDDNAAKKLARRIAQEVADDEDEEENSSAPPE